MTGDLRKVTFIATPTGRVIGWRLIALGVVGTLAGSGSPVAHRDDVEDSARVVELVGKPQPPCRDLANGGSGRRDESRTMFSPRTRRIHR
jgi:hypothetical protein